MVTDPTPDLGGNANDRKPLKASRDLGHKCHGHFRPVVKYLIDQDNQRFWNPLLIVELIVIPLSLWIILTSRETFFLRLHLCAWSFIEVARPSPRS